MRDHRTRPPPADTRRACCHVLSSFQRTGLARPPSVGLSASVRRTFQTYQPVDLVSSLYYDQTEVFRARPPPSFELRRESQPMVFSTLGGRRVAGSCPPLSKTGPRHGARRFLELEGRDARRLLS